MSRGVCRVLFGIKLQYDSGGSLPRAKLAGAVSTRGHAKQIVSGMVMYCCVLEQFIAACLFDKLSESAVRNRVKASPSGEVASIYPGGSYSKRTSYVQQRNESSKKKGQIEHTHFYY